MKSDTVTVTSLPKFKHEKLNSGEIRVFELYPGNSVDPIKGVVRSTRLDQVYKSYEAVSYVWGNTSTTHTIICNGCQMNITLNLHSVLCRLRSTDESLVLWLDGICINQGSTPEALGERSLQVTMMSDVYSNASRVIVDLGDTDRNFDYLIENLKQYAQFDQDPTTLILPNTIKLPGSNVSDLLDTQLLLELIEIMQFPWFSRLWCFQELVLASRVATLLGKRLIPDFDLHLAIARAALRLPQAFIENEELSSLSDKLITSPRGFQCTLMLTTRKQVIQHHFRQKSIGIMLEGLVIASRVMAATDIRDRIYALHALWPNDIISDFATDYMETADVLQQRFSAQLVKKNHGIWTLMFACGPDRGIPSWTFTLAPDEKHYWKQESIAICANSIYSFKPEDDEALWLAGGAFPTNITLGDEVGELLVEGHCFDHVVALSDRLPSFELDNSGVGNGSEESYTAMFDWIAGLLQWIQDLPISEDDMRRTLMFDGYGEVRKTPQYAEAEHRNGVFGSSYQHLKNYLMSETGNQQDHHLAKLFVSQIWAFMPNMRLALTHDGTISAVPHITSMGDQITVLTGVNAPFVLRKQGSNYQVIGACYLHELMDGKLIKRDDWNPKILTII